MGFKSPRYTQTPNDLFDEIMPDLSEAQLKTILYIIRRTLGYHIRKRPMRIATIQKGTKLGRTSVINALTDLAEMNLEAAQDALKTEVALGHDEFDASYRLAVLRVENAEAALQSARDTVIAVERANQEQIDAQEDIVDATQEQADVQADALDDLKEA